MYLNHSFLVGFSASLIFAPTIAVIARNFNKRRGMAMSLSTLGSSVGTIIIPPLLAYANEEFGFFGSILACSALVSHCAISASVFFSSETSNSKSVNIAMSKTEVYVAASEEERVHSNEIRFSSVVRSEGNTSWVFGIRRMMTVLKDRTFLLYCLNMIALPHAMNCVLLFLPALCLEKGYSKSQAGSLISVSGLADATGRIWAGMVFDLPKMRNKIHLLHSCLGMAVGILVILLPFLPTYNTLLIVTVVWGCVMGAFHAQRATVLIQIVNETAQADAIGWITFAQGIGFIIGPSLAGKPMLHLTCLARVLLLST